MSGTNSEQHSPTFIMLQAVVQEQGDRNLKNTLEFVMETLGVNDGDGMDETLSPAIWGETRAELRSVAAKKWTNKSTLRGHLSRITRIAELAETLIAHGFNSHDGVDWAFMAARDEIRVGMQKKKIETFYELDLKAHKEPQHYIGHLFKKTRKYHANRSPKIASRLEELCNFLGLDWEHLRPKLIETQAAKVVSKGLKPSAFAYYMHQDRWPTALQDAVALIEQFHMGLSPGQFPDGSSKRRTEKSLWKVRESDGKCGSKQNLHNILGSFFGYCTLPNDEELAVDHVSDRLKNTSIQWKNEDIPKYAQWLIAEGMDPEEVSIALLFDLALVERRLNWLAKRNGGISKTQPTFSLSLCGLTNRKTGAITQSYEIAAQVLGFPPLPKRALRKSEKEEFHSRMKEWVDYCDSVSTQFRNFQKYFESSKVKKKRNVSSRHEKILEQKDPLAPIESLLIRLCKSEPRHLEKSSQSWLVWARNMTLFELIVSNPLRPDNLCILNYSEDQRAKVQKKRSGVRTTFGKARSEEPS